MRSSASLSLRPASTFNTFADFSNDALLALLHENGVDDADMDKLHKPDEKFIVRALAALLCAATDTSEEILAIPAVCGSDAFKWPPLHDESVVVTNLFVSLRKLMAVVLVNDFSLVDLYKCDSQRLCYLLSGIGNFLRFRAFRDDFFDPIQQRIDGLQAEMDSQEAANRQQAGELERLKGQVSAKEMAVRLLEQREADIEGTLSPLRHQAHELQMEWKDMRTKAEKLTDEKTNLDFTRRMTDKNVQHLKQQIVQSPERLKESVEESRVQCEEMERQLNEQHRHEQHQRRKDTHLQRAEQQQNKHIQLLKKYQENLSATSALSAQLSALRTRLDELTAQREQEEQEQASWSLKCDEAAGNIAHEKEAHVGRVADATERLERAMEVAGRKRGMVETTALKTKAGRTELEMLQEQIKQEKEDILSKESEFLAAHSSLTSAIVHRTHTSTLMPLLSALSSTLTTLTHHTHTDTETTSTQPQPQQQEQQQEAQPQATLTPSLSGSTEAHPHSITPTQHNDEASAPHTPRHTEPSTGKAVAHHEFTPEFGGGGQQGGNQRDVAGGGQEGEGERAGVEGGSRGGDGIALSVGCPSVAPSVGISPGPTSELQASSDFLQATPGGQHWQKEDGSRFDF
ncbi:unnamed protein product [Vitrella brassicaformis CCMP3155]|uniref:Kinetochore protein Nuf2 N-terminal domain-containing protein n=2 Tax=Vitrella brassicaformis TaxID=1169539 RepID=A0A0G4EPK9_VITBC|nr:unnamed protein product [Vitrella brassicaformis CCMP3155]|eukprot:CEL99374.1 unnamed protein product [Vitrella brassicaformis CCMP3155]